MKTKKTRKNGIILKRCTWIKSWDITRETLPYYDSDLGREIMPGQVVAALRLEGATVEVDNPGDLQAIMAAGKDVDKPAQFRLVLEKLEDQ
jgi:hypothetical protein